MNVALIFIGAVRECSDFINENIKSLKESFGESCKITVVFSTWVPSQEKYFTSGVLYTYDYDYFKILKQIENITDVNIFLKQQPLEDYVSLKNGCKPIFIYQLIEIAKYFKEHELKFDFVFKTRHDINLKIIHPEKYFNNFFNISPIHFNNLTPSTLPINSNDHFFICSYENFMKFNELNFKEIAEQAGDNEHFNYLVLKLLVEISYLDFSDIEKYVVRNTRFYVIDGKQVAF